MLWTTDRKTKPYYAVVTEDFFDKLLISIAQTEFRDISGTRLPLSVGGQYLDELSERYQAQQNKMLSGTKYKVPEIITTPFGEFEVIEEPGNILDVQRNAKQASNCSFAKQYHPKYKDYCKIGENGTDVIYINEKNNELAVSVRRSVLEEVKFISMEEYQKDYPPKP